MSASTNQIVRLHAEQEFRHELEALAAQDKFPRPANWRLSPRAVVNYLMGATLSDGTVIQPKYIGKQRLMEIAVSTLATDRALLLFGLPGTAKSWVSEHLAAAISGDSTLMVQGTAGVSEDAIRYGWNYAVLLQQGPVAEAIVETPVMRAMKSGSLVRIEELTRLSTDVQDALITILSEKTMPVPELNTEVQARMGFNLIATANNRDKGVNELSSALKRRFNTVVLPLPDRLEDEVRIVQTRLDSFTRLLEIPEKKPILEEITRIVTIFRELRQGHTLDGKTKIKSPTGTMSTAEAISVMNSGVVLSYHFGAGNLSVDDLVSGLLGTIIKDPVQDRLIFQEYLETVVKKRADWSDLYIACLDQL